MLGQSWSVYYHYKYRYTYNSNNVIKNNCESDYNRYNLKLN